MFQRSVTCRRGRTLSSRLFFGRLTAPTSSVFFKRAFPLRDNNRGQSCSSWFCADISRSAAAVSSAESSPSKPSPFTPNHVCKRKQVRVWSWSSCSGSVWLLQMTPFIYLARRMWNLIFANTAPTDFVIKVAMIIFLSLIFWDTFLL